MPNFGMAYESMIDEMTKEYQRHIYVLESESLLPLENAY